MNSLKNKIINKTSNKAIKKTAVKQYVDLAWAGVKLFGRPVLNWMKGNPAKTGLTLYVLSDENRRDAAKKLIDPIIGGSSSSSGSKTKPIANFT